jgi:lactoylglutathione lyase
MTLEHAAIWVHDLESVKEFYCRYFDGIANKRYVNPVTQFSSYFISFKDGARLELMQRPGIPENLNDTVQAQHLGLIHLAFGVDAPAAVDRMAVRLRSDGIPVLSGPRITGDGYYELEMLDPENNRIEITARISS